MPASSDKLYHRIGEVCRMTGLKPSILRFWETEFPDLAPVKSGSGQRLYSRKDVDLIREIKRFLYTEKLTIAGTRKKLARRVHPEDDRGKEELEKKLREVRSGLLDIRKLLQ